MAQEGRFKAIWRVQISKNFTSAPTMVAPWVDTIWMVETRYCRGEKIPMNPLEISLEIAVKSPRKALEIGALKLVATLIGESTDITFNHI